MPTPAGSDAHGAIAAGLGTFEPRPACSDAERRAALWLHDALRARGYEAWVETVWVRPAWASSLFWHAALGVAGSLIATAAPAIGLAVCLLAAVSFAPTCTGRTGLLDRLAVRRATQVVLVEPPPGGDVEVWLYAATDTPPGGVVWKLRGLGGKLRPGPFWWVLIALGLVTLAAGLWLAGIDAGPLAALQFFPTLILLVAMAAAVDIALAGPAPGDAETLGVAAAVAAFEALRADPPSGTAPGLVLGGAGVLAPLALRGWLRAVGADPARTLIADAGPVRFPAAVDWTARRPQLRAAFTRVAADPTRAVPLKRAPLNRPSALDLRVPAVSVRNGPADADGAALSDAIAAGVRALELQPLRSRANATNQS